MWARRWQTHGVIHILGLLAGTKKAASFCAIWQTS